MRNCGMGDLRTLTLEEFVFIESNGDNEREACDCIENNGKPRLQFCDTRAALTALAGRGSWTATGTLDGLGPCWI